MQAEVATDAIQIRREAMDTGTAQDANGGGLSLRISSSEILRTKIPFKSGLGLMGERLNGSAKGQGGDESNQ